MRKRRQQTETFNFSFLDIISCGFGAIVVLLTILRISEPQINEREEADLAEQLKEKQVAIQSLQAEVQIVQADISVQNSKIQQKSIELVEIQEKLEGLSLENDTLENISATLQQKNAQLTTVYQQLTEEMRRLQQQAPPAFIEGLVGGIPVDSEYIIFIIDTSGSMQKYAWPMVRKKMEEILNIYPTVKGLQVMNDMGDYMFSQYAGRWIRDTPARRNSILKRLSSWQVFSNSSPEEGIVSAIRRFSGGNKKISLYVFGDDFARGSLQDIVDTVKAVNRSGENMGKVRIHAVGFPVLFTQAAAAGNSMRFSALMRRLAEDNYGSFVGITHLGRDPDRK